MIDKSVPPPATPAPSRTASEPTTVSPPTAPPKRTDAAWNPRVNREGTLHGFQGNTPEADSILESPKVRDPEEDTAPLQGTHDRSDEDSLEPGESLEVDE